MIVPNEWEPKTRKQKILYYGLVILISSIVMVAFVYTSVPYINSPHYYAPGSNYAGETGAPDGTYEQGDWGAPLGLDIPWGSETVVYGGWYNNVTDWIFAMCQHEGLGPLHGCWKVQEGTSIPVWQVGVFPVDARLIITLKNNTIIKAEVKSHLVYGD